jgi:hypothetical protein
VRPYGKLPPFPFFDDVHNRLLTVGAIRALMTLCDAMGARVAIVEHSQDTLTVHVTWRQE